jgi:hypothetical protein
MLTFSDTPQYAGWQYPKRLRSPDAFNDTYCFSQGPIAFNNPPTDNVFPNAWWGFVNEENGDVEIGLVGSADVVSVVSLGIPTANWMDITFNQLGNVLIAYEIDGSIFLWWYDPQLAAVTTTNFGAGFEPSISLLIPKAVSTSEIVLSYRVNTDVKYRLGSERYTIERTAPVPPVSKFLGGHMAVNNRVVFAGLPL